MVDDVGFDVLSSVQLLVGSLAFTHVYHLYWYWPDGAPSPKPDAVALNVSAYFGVPPITTTPAVGGAGLTANIPVEVTVVQSSYVASHRVTTALIFAAVDPEPQSAEVVVCELPVAPEMFVVQFAPLESQSFH